MKKLLLLSLFILTYGCTPKMYVEKTAIGDFRKYTEENFVVSPISTGYNYDPVAEIEINFYPGNRKKDNAKIEKIKPAVEDPIYGTTAPASPMFVNTKNYEWFDPSYDYIVSQLVTKAKELGANGILEVKITDVTTNSKYSEITRYKATGFAVKIKR